MKSTVFLFTFQKVFEKVASVAEFLFWKCILKIQGLKYVGEKIGMKLPQFSVLPLHDKEEWYLYMVWSYLGKILIIWENIKFCNSCSVAVVHFSCPDEHPCSLRQHRMVYASCLYQLSSTL